MAPRYKISEIAADRGTCRVTGIQNVPDWAKMHFGVPQSGRFPADAFFAMDPDFPKDVKLVDVVDNENRFVVVSERLLSFLSSANALRRNEVHEVGIVNHKGRREKARYFVVHQVDHIPCIDEGQTVGTKGKLEPIQYIIINKLVLDESKIDPEIAIFRPAQYSARAFFRRDLVDAIEAEGFTGIEFFDVAEYTEF